ncbi:MAG: 2-oxoglutarate dehydrogenase E1 subunit family protein, partial [Methylocella sp.]
MARRDANGNANGSGGGADSRSAPNSAFARTSFLDGVNAAYVERLQDSYVRDPASLDPSWREFFAQMNDDSAAIAKRAHGPRWKRPGSPAAAAGDLVSALDGDWTEAGTRIGAKLEAKTGEGALLSQAEVQRATRDSVRALMMIRAYRMRGHFHANLDPLGIEPPKDHEELHPAAYGFTEADYNRTIFIDGVLGLQFASVPEMLKILRRTYCGTIGFEFMHISDPAEKGWLQRRIEGPGKEITFTKEG